MRKSSEFSDKQKHSEFSSMQKSSEFSDMHYLINMFSKSFTNNTLVINLLVIEQERMQLSYVKLIGI